MFREGFDGKAMKMVATAQQSGMQQEGKEGKLPVGKRPSITVLQ